MIARYFLLYLLVCLLSACVSTPIQQSPTNTQLPQQHIEKIASIRNFSLKGRIGVQMNGKGFSGPITWRHHAEYDLITLYSPLGNPVAIIEKNGDKITLTDSKGNAVNEDNLQSLTEKTLGWPLPLQGMTDWILGRPSAQQIQLQTRDSAGRLTKLKQENWDIDYQAYMPYADVVLPQKLHLRRIEANVKLVIENWADITY
jgi:outer membrane lipoprotein LolB